MPVISTQGYSYQYATTDYGILLNGTNQYGYHNNDLPNIEAMSIWIKPTNNITTATSSQTVIQTQTFATGADEGVYLGNSTGLLTNETIAVHKTIDPTGHRTGVQNFTLTASQWYNIIINWSGSLYNIIVDDSSQSLVSGGTGHAPLFTTTSILTVGAQRGPTTRFYLSATIANLILFDTALSSGEITSIVNDGPYGSTSVSGNEIGAYRFNEGFGVTAHDESGNGNHLTLVNTPTWV